MKQKECGGGDHKTTKEKRNTDGVLLKQQHKSLKIAIGCFVVCEFVTCIIYFLCAAMSVLIADQCIFVSFFNSNTKQYTAQKAHGWRPKMQAYSIAMIIHSLCMSLIRFPFLRLL
jgi:hypothetical protein